MKDCLYCKKPFEPKRPKAIYCSTNCRVYGNRQKRHTEKVVAALKGDKKIALKDVLKAGHMVYPLTPDQMLSPQEVLDLMMETGVLWTPPDKQPEAVTIQITEKNHYKPAPVKPAKMPNESGIDYAIRLAEWKKVNNL